MLNEKGLIEFTIGIAGIGLSFLFDQNLSESGVEDIDYEFITEIRPETKLLVHQDSFPQRSKGKKIFDSGSTWSLFREQGKYVLQDSSFDSDPPPNQLVILESDLKSGDIYINDKLFKNLLLDPLGYPLNQILMILLLSRCKGVMLHACGIDDRGYGYLFLGNSGHGKSTIARLWSENQATVLNDDRIIVREKNGELLMYGTPWPGDFKEVSSKGLPIRKLFFLRHGKKNSAVPKNSTEAVLMLLTRCFPPIWDKKGMEYTMGLCHRMVNKVPCYEFSFEPDRKIVDFVKNI
ncbi:MAG TPA: hypothetical protein VMW81_08185 [Nitrospinota bacterium]|nr:hypothetical protein [Nitrospinota bacterium]